MSENKDLSIFQLLTLINKKDIHAYDELNKDNKKKLSLFLVLKWMASSTIDTQIILLNNTLNRYIFSLVQHETLLYYLSCISSCSERQRYKWTYKKKTKQTSVHLDLIKRCFNCNNIKAQEYFILLTNENILEYANAIGFTREKLTVLKKELNHVRKLE